MKTPLIALFALVLTLPLGCKVEDDTPDPLANREGFCHAWAQNACQAKVVENCNANSADDCEATQSDFCLGVIPEHYSSAHAKACLDAVKSAYGDASLSPDDISVVIKLGAPCDQLSKGTSEDGESCTTNDDCSTATGFSCILKQGATEGTCAKPDEVGPGEDCSGDTQVCGDGNYCNGENCVAYKKTGGACEGDYQCKPEDRCVVPTDATAGTCDARLALNADCTSDDDCESHYCAITPKETTGQCASTIVLSRNEPLCLNLR